MVESLAPQSIAAATKAKITDVTKEKTVDTPKKRAGGGAKLGQANFFKLCTWLLAKDTKGIYTIADLTRVATDELKWPRPIATSSMTEALDATGVKLDVKEPKQKPPAKGVVVNLVVIDQLNKLLQLTGCEPTPGFKALCEQLKSELER
jgi:hypothetical protein